MIQKPILMFAWLDGHVRQYAPDDLRWFAKRLAEGRIDYLRLLPTWKDDRAGIMPQPFLNKDLNEPNSLYNMALKSFCNILHEQGIKVAMDAMDQCAFSYKWNTWTYNTNGVYGIYNTSDKLYQYLIKFVDRVKACGVDLIGLGNELSFPHHLANMDGLHAWTEDIILPLSKYLLEKYKQPFLYYSADNYIAGTSNKIRAYLTEPGYGNLSRNKVIEVLHGMGTPFQWKSVAASDTLSSAVSMGMSDDGVGIGGATLDPSERGLCEDPGQRCKASQALRLATVDAMEEDLGSQFVLVEFLAPEIAMAWKNPVELDWKYSVETYRKVLKRYGIKPPALIPDITYTNVEVCSSTGFLPNKPYCPLETRKFEKGKEPGMVCPLHKAPDEPVDDEEDPVEPPQPDTRTCRQKHLSGGIRKWQPWAYLKCLIKK